MTGQSSPHRPQPSRRSLLAADVPTPARHQDQRRSNEAHRLHHAAFRSCQQPETARRTARSRTVSSRTPRTGMSPQASRPSSPVNEPTMQMVDQQAVPRCAARSPCARHRSTPSPEPYGDTTRCDGIEGIKDIPKEATEEHFAMTLEEMSNAQAQVLALATKRSLCATRTGI